jgi:PAS domain S-box-containing protein
LDDELREGQAPTSPSSTASTTVTPFDLEAGLQKILDHSTTVMFVKDVEGRYTMVNDAFLRPIGLARDDVIGRTANELWPDYDVLGEADQSVLRSGVIDVRDEVVELAAGTHTYLTVRFPLRDPEGRIDAMGAIATDVTERKAMEEALEERDQLLDTILRASPDIVTVIDEQARVTAVSDASADILGYDLSDPVREDLKALVHPEDFPEVYGAYSGLLTRRDRTIDVRHRVRRSDGNWVTFETRGQAIVGHDGVVTGAVVVSRDVTEDLELEEELQRALETAEQASAAKSNFLSRMSHELRTPLNSVLGFAQLLQMEELPPERAEAVGHILEGGNHLLDLIDEVLDIARIESGRLDLSVQPLELVPLLREAVALIRPMAERQSVQLVLDAHALAGPEHVLADRQRLLQVLLNLLSNAVKYNDLGGNVEISTAPAPSGEGRVLISVADDGSGIAPEALERVFDPFERLGAERGAVEGTGVGLTLSKHLVEQMGGEIVVSSELGVGTTFTVALAASESLPPESLPPESLTDWP